MQENKIVVINLDRAGERKEKISAQLDAQKLKYYIYSGFDAKNLTNKTVSPGKLVKGYGSPRDFKKGEMGCTLSHIGVITMAKTLGWENVVILEDDIVLCKDFEKRLKLLFKYLPKTWEHVFLGGHLYNHIPLLKPSCVPSPKISGTYSYMLNHTVYDKAIKELSSMETTTDDLYEHMKLKSYIFFPLFSYPLLEYSYVNEEKENRIHSSKPHFAEYL